MTVLGFLVQCDICPQKAIVDTQPAKGWVCPRCTDAHGGFGDVDVAQAEPVRVAELGSQVPVPREAIESGHDIGLTHAAEMFPQHQHPLARRHAAMQSVAKRIEEIDVLGGSPPCPHQDVRFGACADCGKVTGYPWGEHISAPECDDPDYPLGKVQG